MSREDRLRFRLRVRLRVRLRGRLRFPAASVPLRGFPCVQAGFRWVALCDISMSAGESPVPRPLPGDPLRLVPSLSLGCADGRLLPWAARPGALAVRSPPGLLVTWAWTVSLACRVVASRRCSGARTPLVVSADAPSVRSALAGLSCAVQLSVSRRLAGRWDDGRRAAPRRSWLRAGQGGGRL